MNEMINRYIRDSRSHLELALDRINLRIPETEQSRRQIDDLLARSRLATQRLVESSKLRLATAEAALSALGPTKILRRGYTVTRLGDGTAATSASQFSVDDNITVTFADGDVDATVGEVTIP